MVDKIWILRSKKERFYEYKHIFPHYTNTCTQIKDQLVMIRTATGDHEKFTSLILKDLIKLIDLNHFLNPYSIHEEPYWTENI